MKAKETLIKVVIGLWALLSSVHGEEDQAVVPLFNGKDLSG
jgi:hypothetical protein